MKFEYLIDVHMRYGFIHHTISVAFNEPISKDLNYSWSLKLLKNLAERQLQEEEAVECVLPRNQMNS